MRFHVSSRIVLIRLASMLIAVTACSRSTDSDSGPALGRVVVLNGQGETGISVLPDNGGTPVLLPFSYYDGASFSLRNDTVASAASKSKGDLLYVGDLASKRVVKVQLPAGSNPAGAAFGNGIVPGPTGGVGTVIFVALRDMGSVTRVLFRNTGGAPVVESFPGAGLCPVDVVISTTAVWGLDSNQRCSTDYATIGPSRMIPIFNMGSSDTITFGANVLSAQRAFVVGNNAYIMSAGDYFSVPSALTNVNLGTRAFTTLPLPTDYYGASLRVGANGTVYLTAAPAYPNHLALKVFAIDPAAMAFTGTRAVAQSYLRLVKIGGAEAACFAATADAAGNVYCLENGDVLARLLVFNSAGDQIRSAPAGSLAYDITLR